jgi:hypothetical protein
VGDRGRLVRDRILGAARAQREALLRMPDLVLHGLRASGRAGRARAGRCAGDAGGDAADLRRGSVDAPLARGAFAFLQLERSLEGLLLQAERLTDRRVASAGGAGTLPPLRDDEEASSPRCTASC